MINFFQQYNVSVLRTTVDIKSFESSMCSWHVCFKDDKDNVALTLVGVTTYSQW